MWCVNINCSSGQSFKIKATRTYTTASIFSTFGEVHPRISPGDKGLACGISTSYTLASSLLADWYEE